MPFLISSGVHHRKKECEATATKVINKVQEILGQVKRYLFPPFVAVTPLHLKKSKVPRGNGGWGDKRDVKLCEAMARPLSDYGGDPEGALAVARDADMRRKGGRRQTVQAPRVKVVEGVMHRRKMKTEHSGGAL